MGGCSVTSVQEKPIVIGVIADVQYADCMPAGSRHFRTSLEKLAESVDFFNQTKPIFVVSLGDLIDRSPADLSAPLASLKSLEVPVYHLLGNHDYRGGSTSRWLVNQLQMPATYYTQSQGNWTFVFLDTNDLSVYTCQNDSINKDELMDLLAQLEKTKAPQNENWNGGIGKQQLQWLDGILTQCEKESRNVVLFSHHPLYPKSRFSALNYDQIVEVIDRYSCVKAAFAGHHHDGNFAFYKGIPFFTLEGMVETPNKNAYGLVYLYEKKVELVGYGRMRSYPQK